jgi:hypothetical protein
VTSPEPEPDFNDLLLMLKETRGFDFTGYKPSTTQRRIRRRMAVLDLGSFSQYRDYLELQPEGFTALFDSMLINVTSFFRDPPAWQALSEVIIPELLHAKGAGAGPGLERGLRDRRGSVHASHHPDRGAGPRAVPRSGEDLRHRPGRGRAAAGPGRGL